MERHNGIEFDPEGAFVYYDDAQHALDVERARVKELQGAASTPINELLAELISCAGVFDVSTDYEDDRKALETATQAVLDHVATLQVQLADKDRRIWELESWLQVKSPQEITLMESQIIKLQAQLRQVEGERDALKLVNETHMKTVMKLSSIIEKSSTMAHDAGKGAQA